MFSSMPAPGAHGSLLQPTRALMHARTPRPLRVSTRWARDGRACGRRLYATSISRRDRSELAILGRYAALAPCARVRPASPVRRRTRRYAGRQWHRDGLEVAGASRSNGTTLRGRQCEYAAGTVGPLSAEPGGGGGCREPSRRFLSVTLSCPQRQSHWIGAWASVVKARRLVLARAVICAHAQAPLRRRRADAHQGTAL